MSGESSMAEMVGVPASVLFWLAIVWGILLGIDFFSQRILLTVARLRAQWRDPRLGLIEAARRASGRRHMLVFGDGAAERAARAGRAGAGGGVVHGASG